LTTASDPAPFSVSPVTAEHRADWDLLYAAYADFYGTAQSAEMRDLVWSWLGNKDHELDGFLAVDEKGRGIGLAHFRPFTRPLAASTGGFIDDLFVLPEWRGKRVADALVAAVVAQGRQRGWSVVRWITAEDNQRGRAFYDRIAERTHWVTYQIPLG
jgi:GNAT superfamily N-acetyltransferase